MSLDQHNFFKCAVEESHPNCSFQEKVKPLIHHDLQGDIVQGYSLSCVEALLIWAQCNYPRCEFVVLLSGWC